LGGWLASGYIEVEGIIPGSNVTLTGYHSHSDEPLEFELEDELLRGMAEHFVLLPLKAKLPDAEVTLKNTVNLGPAA
jgi:hypothetical protein